MMVSIWRRADSMAVAGVMLMLVTGLQASTARATVVGGPGLIAYIDLVSGYQHLFVMAQDGTNAVDLDPGFAGIDDNPAWSPDGTKLAFRHGSHFGDGEIWLVDPDGSDMTRLTNETRNADQPAWSPDGSMIVYSVRGKLVKIDVDGTNRAELVRGDMPDWSPKGDRIAFSKYVSVHGHYASDIFVMNADGTDVTNVTKTDAVSEWNPGWGPDARTIVFQRSVGDHDIWTMRPNGRRQIALTRDTRFFDGYASYSPDGTRIVFAHESKIFTMNASGSGKTRLTDHYVPAYGTSWQPLSCTIQGTEGPDPDLVGTPGDDIICALGGGDVVDSIDGNDTIIAGPGDDQLIGGSGNDILVGQGGNDLLRGEAGIDRMAGGVGGDRHVGGSEDDYLYGWDYAGSDALRGGSGVDVCAYDRGDVVRC